MEDDDIIGLDRELANIASPNSFVLIVRDESMLPAFKVGDIVILDPTIQPQPGEIVGVRLPKEKDILVRKYRPLPISSETKPGAFELIPLNEDWPRITIHDKTQGTIVGTLIEHRCRRRVTPSK